MSAAKGERRRRGEECDVKARKKAARLRQQE
jgi:hypothetical protein